MRLLHDTPSTAIQEALRAHTAHIRQHFKAEITGIFGSYARGDTHPDSNLDLLADFEPGASLFDQIGLEHFLEDTFGRKVDVVSQRGLRADIQEAIARETLPL